LLIGVGRLVDSANLPHQSGALARSALNVRVAM
jgi:hypothetical protein